MSSKKRKWNSRSIYIYSADRVDEANPKCFGFGKKPPVKEENMSLSVNVSTK